MWTSMTHQFGLEGGGVCREPVSASGGTTNKGSGRRASLADRAVSEVMRSRGGSGSYLGEGLSAKDGGQ